MKSTILYLLVVIAAQAYCSPHHGLNQSDRVSTCLPPTKVDADKYPSSAYVRRVTSRICQGGLRLPGSPKHLRTVEYIRRQLARIPGLMITESDFELADWQPAGDSMYQAAHLEVDGQAVDVASAIAYSLPTNGSAISGQLLYLAPGDDITQQDLKGKIVMRDYPLLTIPRSLFADIAYYASPDATQDPEENYVRPFVTPPHADLLAASLGGAAGYISAFNVSREQLEGYYSGHSGTHWLLPGVFTGAEQYATLKQAAQSNGTASIRIDATSGIATVPRIHAVLPGMSPETIVLATHTDGVTYVQENGPAALLTLAQYFASLPKSARAKTIMFAFEASHLAYQLDSDKTLAKSLDSTYDNGTTAFVIAIEHLGTKEIEQRPAPNGGPGNELYHTGFDEPILWSVGEVQPAIDSVVNIVKDRALSVTVVAPGFPPPNPADMVPTYASMGGLGTYYTNALLPTMALISGPWSLWAPSFGTDALDYDRLRMEHIAIGDIILSLSQYSKQELAGNYTTFRRRRTDGAKTITINYDDAQFITNPNATYY